MRSQSLSHLKNAGLSSVYLSLPEKRDENANF